MNAFLRKKFLFQSFTLFIVLCFTGAQSGWAEVSPQMIEELVKTNKELVSKVTSLESEVQVLKGRLSHVESGAQPAAIPAAGGEEGGVVRTVGSDLKLSGFVDTSFNKNFQNPAPDTAAGNNLTADNSSGNSTLRAFDREANTFDLNNLQLNIRRPAPEKGGVGFNTELMFGSDAQVAESAGFLGGADEVSIQEAHAEIKVPVGSGLTVLAGKFATLHGAEVIENYQNWLASRSFLFNLAIPFTHTGVRAIYNWFDGKVTTIAGVVNGWDQAIDVNNMKDIEAMVKWTPFENFFVSQAFMIGSQQVGDRGSPRGILDTVVNWTPFPDDSELSKLHLMANYDYGWEEDLGALTLQGSGVADWQGYALYAKYDLANWVSLAARFEQFWDDQGVRTGLTTTGAELWSMAYNADFKIYDNLLTRLEYRHDLIDTKVGGFDSGTNNTQDTVMASLIYLFA